MIMAEEIVHAQSLVWALINNKYTHKNDRSEKRGVKRASDLRDVEMFAPALQFGSSVCLMSFLKPDLYGLSKPINLEWFNCQKRHKEAPEHTQLLHNQNLSMAARRHLIASAKFYTKSALAGCLKTPKQTSKHLCYDQILFEMTSHVFFDLWFHLK